MIELSKCPTCASEDKVTIAGKDFCMRCGTPSPDDANQSTNIAPVVTTAESNQQNTGSVTKFTEAPAVQAVSETNQPAQTVNAPTPNIPQVTSAAAPTNFSAETVSTPNVPVTNTSNFVSQPASEVVNQPVQPSNIEQSETPVEQPQTVSQVPVSNNTNEVVQNTTTAGEQIPQPQPGLNTSEHAGNETIVQAPIQPVQTDQPPVPIPAEQHESTISPAIAPDPIQIPTDQPLTMPTQTPKPEEQPTPQINTHSMPMNLETHDDSGVFSDAQLDALSKSAAAPIDLERPSDSNDLESNQQPIHRDIQPPAATDNQPAQPTQPVVAKVAENDAKAVDKKTKSKKALKPAGIALSIVALFLVGAYIWQVNYPTLAFKIASAKAGMSASMPGYMPGGYKLAGEIQTNPGAVTYSLVNNSQGKKIAISQTKTDWDSQALAENYVAPKAENYLALQAQGLTIYMLGDTQATWVNKGTWYKIESTDQSLSQDQAIKIATSL